MHRRAASSSHPSKPAQPLPPPPTVLRDHGRVRQVRRIVLRGRGRRDRRNAELLRCRSSEGPWKPRRPPSGPPVGSNCAREGTNQLASLRSFFRSSVKSAGGADPGGSRHQQSETPAMLTAGSLTHPFWDNRHLRSKRERLIEPAPTATTLYLSLMHT